MVVPYPPVDLDTKDGSNLALNYSNLVKSFYIFIYITILVTDFLACFKASSKCFLEISGTGSYFAKLADWLGSIWMADFILASASIDY